MGIWPLDNCLYNIYSQCLYSLAQANDGQKLLLTDSHLNAIHSVYKGLNSDQKKAVQRCLSGKDYVMILGMPGTGKTTTIACIVSVLVSFGKSVLITSYTHTAVDNILVKIKQVCFQTCSTSLQIIAAINRPDFKMPDVKSLDLASQNACEKI